MDPLLLQLVEHSTMCVVLGILNCINVHNQGFDYSKSRNIVVHHCHCPYTVLSSTLYITVILIYSNTTIQTQRYPHSYISLPSSLYFQQHQPFPSLSSLQAFLCTITIIIICITNILIQRYHQPYTTPLLIWSQHCIIHHMCISCHHNKTTGHT